MGSKSRPRPRARRARSVHRAEPLEPRLLLATISGQVWNDADGDGRQTLFERGLSGWTVYVDLNNNGSVERDEPTAVTDASGNYSISNDLVIRLGTYHVRGVMQSGWRPTAPDDGEQTVTFLRLGDDATGVDFGNTRRALVTGTVFNDADDDGAFDRGEAGLSGWTVFADADNDGVLDAGEPTALTDSNGDYDLNLPAGTHTIRQVTQAGWWQTAPAGGVHAVTLAAGEVAPGRDFGNLVATVDLLGTVLVVTSPVVPVPADGRLDIDYVVRNNGTADSAPFYVALYLSDDPTISTADTLLREVAWSSVPRHDSVARTTSLTLPRPDPFRTDNEYFIGMVVDSTGLVTETDEANNRNRGVAQDSFPLMSEGDLPRPVDNTSARARPIALGTSVASALGDEWVGAYDVDAYRFDVGAGHRLEVTLADPDGGGSIRLYGPSWSLLQGPDTRLGLVAPSAGTYHVVVSGAGNDGANPRRLTGRAAGATGDYTLTALDHSSDLFGEIFSWGGNPPGPMSIGFRVEGEGIPLPFGVGPFDVAVYLSDDTQITTADRLLTTVRVTTVPVQGEDTYYTALADFNLPAIDPYLTDNEYWVGLVVDSSNEIPERNETNNSNRGPSRDMMSWGSERDLPSPADGSGPGGSSIPFGTPIDAEIGDEWVGAHDQDIFPVRANAGERLRFDVDTDGGGLNSYMRLFDGSWTLIAGNDDGRAPGEAAGTDSYVEHLFASATTAWVVISASGNHTNDPLRLAGRSAASTGAYALTVTSVPAGPVTGTVFDDANANGVRDPGEAGLGGWSAYLGSPDSDLRIGQPPGALTDATGLFTIPAARPATYGVRVAPLAGWLRTAPAQQASHVVSLTSGQPAGPFEFGFVRAATVSGAVFDDVDSDGTRDPGEAGLAGWTVYLDANNNGVRDQATLTFGASGLTDPGDVISRVRVPADLFARVVDVDVLVNATVTLAVDYALLHEGAASVTLAINAQPPLLPSRFDDEATGNDFRVLRPLSPLAAFDGTSAEGVWRLFADFDPFGPLPGGTLRSWTLLLTLGEPAAVTDANGNYNLAGVLPGERHVRVVPGNPDDWIPTGPAGGGYALALAPGEAAAGNDFGAHLRRLRVEGRHFFYNNSGFDGRNPAANPADDAALAADKRPLLPGGGAATFANVTSYAKGINGIMLDVDEFRGALALTDFEFMATSPFNPSQWIPAPAPSGFSVRPLDVPGAPDRRRVTFTWPDGLIRNMWLRVTLLANANTRSLAPDVSYFGNLVGETGGAFAPNRVTPQDFLATRAAAYRGRAAVDSRFDHDRDGFVTVKDVAIVRSNLYRSLPAPVIAAPAAGVTSASPPPEDHRATGLLNDPDQT